MQQAILDVEEALILEDLGAKINLTPAGTSVKSVKGEEGCWEWKICSYPNAVPLSVFFYFFQNNLAYLLATQGEVDHDITDEEQLIVEEAFDWLASRGKFND